MAIVPVAQGSEFIVNATTIDFQVDPTICMLADARFVVAWASHYTDLPGSFESYDIIAQIFSPNGQRIGGEFVVNSTTSGWQSLPTIAALPTGGFVVAWQDPSAGNANISAQVFDSQGNRLGAEISVNTTTQAFQLDPTICVLTGGNFVV